MNGIKLAVPPTGPYTEAFEEAFKSLDVEIIKGDITERTINFGVKHSPVMMCYPYKVILGYIMDVLDKGATKVIYSSTNGECRFRHFWKVHEHTLKELGYDDFEFVVLRPKTLLHDIKRVNPKVGWVKVIKAFINFWKKIKEIEKNNEDFNLQKINKNNINILVVGEIYTILIKDMNLSLVDKLKKFGAKPKYAFCMSKFIKQFLSLTKKDKYELEALQYLDGPTGGLGLYTLSHVIYGCEKGYDGIVHIMPMTCSPEIVIEPAINMICQKKEVPLLRVECDENNSEVNMDTRLETFIELIKRKKSKAK